ncbi:hypothetical protein [Kineosporia sp. NBRC 101731]|uniref:hypothetical protein n=1 Tax=Kineosporia sp. NBRC 101731 TaxID=3032199 RepID=UPI0024A509E9|nr:hypothetical protein [Kineosporia sp. NBRC 101731]GLY28860.1 hypothetical protein Kisp02_22250 [Kineosporia sp. NBRC 101731]
MPADVEVDPEAVKMVVTAMNSRKDEIISDLNILHTAVATMLTIDGGLWMNESSPVMSTSFQAFSNNLSEAISNIKNFADSFGSTVENLLMMDHGYASQDPEDS